MFNTIQQDLKAKEDFQHNLIELIRNSDITFYQLASVLSELTPVDWARVNEYEDFKMSSTFPKERNDEA